MSSISVFKKVILCGFDVETYDYQNSPVVRGVKRRHKINRSKKPVISLDRSVARAKKAIKRLIKSNPDLQYFFTLTFAENLKDINEANYNFKKFVQRLRYVYPEFRYLAVHECQERGAVHYHLLVNDFSGIGFVPFDRLREIWGHGRLELAKVETINSTTNYLIHYLTKQDSSFYNKKRYFYSRDLNRPIELINQVAVKFLSKTAFFLKKVFETSFFLII